MMICPGRASCSALDAQSSSQRALPRSLAPGLIAAPFTRAVRMHGVAQLSARPLGGQPLFTKPSAKCSAQEQQHTCSDSGFLHSKKQSGAFGALGFTAFIPVALVLLYCEPAAALTEAASLPGYPLVPLLGVAAAGSAIMLLVRSVVQQARRLSALIVRLQQATAARKRPRRNTRGRPSFQAQPLSFDEQDSGQQPPLLATSLTGTTQEHLQSYMPHAAVGIQRHNPAVIAVRNRALATAASYSVQVAVKDSRPHIRQLLQQLQAAHASSNCRTAKPVHKAASRVHDPEAAVLHLATQQLARVEEAQGRPIAWHDLDQHAMDALQQLLVKAVAEHAAMEQVQAIVSVVVAEQDRGAWPWQPPGGKLWMGGTKRPNNRPGKGRGIRGGGAM